MIRLLIGLGAAFLIQPSFADVDKLRVPAGFAIERLNFEVSNARQMALTDSGILIVGSRREGKVYAVADALTADQPEVVTLFTGLTMPSGVAVHDGDLYIGAVNRIIRVRNIEQHLVTTPPHQVWMDDLPDHPHHGWKYLKVGPDGHLYVPVGAPCNICLSQDERFASLLRVNMATATAEIWARGIRNTVGFDWHPQTRRLWFTDNGRDMMGDDVPPEEINVITKPGQHFGYPFLHGENIADPRYGDHEAGRTLTFTSPVLNIQAHSAALGIDFYTGDHFPAEYSGALFVAEHGSWNRSSKVGYRVSVVLPGPEGELIYRPFVEGWLVGQIPWGRPNDVLVTPAGHLLISDDAEGVIYRVRYEET